MATGEHQMIMPQIGLPGVFIPSIVAMVANWGAGRIGMIANSQLPSILTFVGTLVIAVATIGKAIIDRDKRRDQELIASLKDDLRESRTELKAIKARQPGGESK